MKRSFILAFLFVLTLGNASAQNLNSYKDKMLEFMASRVKTTKEMFVEDLDVKVDSMSLGHFLVEDSIYLLEKQLNKEIEEQNKLINYHKGYIEETKNKKPKSGDNIINDMFKTMDANTINNSNHAIKKAEGKIQKIKAAYAPKLESLYARDKKAVLYDAFRCRVIFKHPRTGIRQVLVGYTFFVPGELKLINYENIRPMEVLMESKRNK